MRIARLDLETETLLDYIEHPPNWTDEEVEAWPDWDAEETIEVERQVQAEFDTRGGLNVSHLVLAHPISRHLVNTPTKQPTPHHRNHH